MVRSTVKSTYFKKLQFPFFKIFYGLIVHYVINFVFSIGKQPYLYRDVISFVLYIYARRAKLGQIQEGLQRAIQDSTKGGLQKFLLFTR